MNKEDSVLWKIDIEEINKLLPVNVNIFLYKNWKIIMYNN